MINWNITPRRTSIVDRNETRIVQAMSHGIWQSDLIFFYHMDRMDPTSYNLV